MVSFNGLITFFFLDCFEEEFHIVALRDHVYKDVVLFPVTFVLVAVYKLSGATAVKSLGFRHVFLLVDIFLFCVRKSCAQKVEHLYIFFLSKN